MPSFVAGRAEEFYLSVGIPLPPCVTNPVQFWAGTAAGLREKAERRRKALPGSAGFLTL